MEIERGGKAVRPGRSIRSLIGIAAMLLPVAAWSATYTVGPSGRQYRQLSEVFAANDLAPGDIVEVDGNATYDGGIVIDSDDGGSALDPVIIRWRRTDGATRPLLKGGQYHTVKFQQSNHVVFEGFEVSGGPNSCIFTEAHDVTVRDVIIRDCPAHGILGADQLSGSFTLEYSEIYSTGSGTSRHPIYMQSDEVAFPGSVFRMRYNYVHSGNGGNLLKVRHERSEIYYNWLEGAAYQALEFIGPDCWEQPDGWATDLKREDADVVGNVIIQSGDWANAIRIGGDLNGRSQGRVRLVNNTILFTRSGAANAVMVQLGAGSLEMHNNLIHQTTGGAPVIVRENRSVDDMPEPCSPQRAEPWDGARKVAGSGNWVKDGATLPPEWTGTISGSDPRLTDIGQGRLRPLPGSPLIGRGALRLDAPSAFPFPSPLPSAQFEPPLGRKMAPGNERQREDAGRAELDIGAFPSTADVEIAGEQAHAGRKLRKWPAQPPTPYRRDWLPRN